MPLPSFKDSIPNYPDFSSDGSDLLNFAQMLLPDNPLRNRVSFNRTRFGVYRVPRNRLWRGSRKYRQPYQVEASCLQIKCCVRFAPFVPESLHRVSPPLCATSGRMRCSKLYRYSIASSAKI